MKRTVAVIYGGRSGEHEVSVRSAQSIIGALDPERYSILHFFISKEGKWSPRPILPEPNRHPEIDVVFPILHGTFGEDGTMQGLLELAALPYVGPGVLASAAAMDKDMTKRILRDSGVPVVDYLAVTGLNPRLDEIEAAFDYPLFVKPANLGSSVGISKAGDRPSLQAAIAFAAQYDSKVIVERTIVGQEIECSVIGNEDPHASTPCEILPSRDFYDYDDKYLLDKTEFRLPADLPPERLEDVRKIAIDAYRALQCEGMSRVDFLLERSTGKIYLNEVNTIPGFTSISMYPKMWEHSGLPYPKLLDQLIDLAMARHASRKALKYSR